MRNREMIISTKQASKQDGLPGLRSHWPTSREYDISMPCRRRAFQFLQLRVDKVAVQR